MEQIALEREATVNLHDGGDNCIRRAWSAKVLYRLDVTSRDEANGIVSVEAITWEHIKIDAIMLYTSRLDRDMEAAPDCEPLLVPLFPRLWVMSGPQVYRMARTARLHE